MLTDIKDREKGIAENDTVCGESICTDVDPYGALSDDDGDELQGVYDAVDDDGDGGDDASRFDLPLAANLAACLNIFESVLAHCV
jgi:hypothetical protein